MGIMFGVGNIRLATTGFWAETKHCLRIAQPYSRITDNKMEGSQEGSQGMISDIYGNPELYRYTVVSKYKPIAGGI
jgi:hypothetical protein